MSKIHILEPQLANMIAAGEVVERPSAVLKELIENALDAHAKHIEIYLEEGGISALEVNDDGEGMDEADALAAFSRHATSKIQTQEDLFAPKHLGFRGEALPSIASVSRTILSTAQTNSGTRVVLEYGNRVQSISISKPQGTSVRVEHLFRNTPARLKHLKSSSYESALCVAVCEKFALSRPDVAFVLKDETKTILNTSGNGKLLDVFSALYGNRLARFAHAFEFKDYDFKISGLWIEPQENRSTQKEIQIFINGRMIRHFRLVKAVTEAYEPFLLSHRYPIVLMHIELDAKLVDVNVHPSKWEVRLSKEQQLYYLIVDELSKQLHTKVEAKTSELDVEETPVQVPLFDLNHYVPDPSISQVSLDVDAYHHPTFPVLDLIGQMHGRYILASTADELYWIDQHAAKERVNYEKILESISQPMNQMDLIVPFEVEASLSFMERFESFKEALDPLGIELERFALNSYLIRKIPTWIENWDLGHLSTDLMERFENEHKLDQASLQDSILATMACHRSVRFNQALTVEDMKQILNELSQCKQPYQCPHGRPTLVKISQASLWKDFER